MITNSRHFSLAIVKSHLMLVFIACICCLESSFARAQVEHEQEEPTLRAILRHNTKRARELTLRRQQFINNAISAFIASSAHDSVTTLQLRAPADSLFYLTLDNIGRIPYLGADPFAKKLRLKAGDVPPMFNLNHFVGGILMAIEDWKKRNINSWPIPDDTETDVLNVLWRKQIATGSEIYALIDTSNHLSSEDLQAELQQMVSRGFIDRKQISPSQEFKLSGIFKIEIKSKNRKNRVFLYWPAVNREKLISYIDSQRNWDAVSSTDERKLAELDRRLERSLYRLRQSRR